MPEIILARHAESHANNGDFVAFGNNESPLTDHGIEEALAMRAAFGTRFAINPGEYERAVLASTFTRTQQTAEVVGFRVVDISSSIDEARVDKEVRSGIKPAVKHAKERWVPDTIKGPAASFVDGVQSGELDYEIFFTHGMFTAGVLLECDARGIDHGVPFDIERGYVPLRAALTQLTIS